MKLATWLWKRLDTWTQLILQSSFMTKFGYFYNDLAICKDIYIDYLACNVCVLSCVQSIQSSAFKALYIVNNSL